MKKRVLEAAAIFAAVAAVFIITNLFMGGIDNATAEIDGAVYSTGETELDLALMTTEGVENLAGFRRLEKLKIQPYITALVNSYQLDDPSKAAAVRLEAEKTYPECTSLDDISFLADVSSLRVLDISYCETDDISCLAALENLEALNISCTKVDSLDSLRQFSRLETLYINGLDIGDMSPLLEMEALKKLSVDEGADKKIITELKSKGVTVDVVPMDEIQKFIEMVSD